MPSVPLPTVRWAFCCCPCGSPPFAGVVLQFVDCTTSISH
nr:MAG TPA: hypothetical protein [Caudoviricetes sp.]